MVRIGLVGVGFMGMIHYLAAQRLSQVKVTAIHTRDRKKLAGDWTSIRGNYGPTGQQMDLGNIGRYEQFEQLLADPNVDLVDICTPTYLHAPMAIAALKAGKHVLVEKAISLTLDEADAMLEAARSAGKLLMVAHVLPFFPEFQFVVETIHQSSFGKLLGGHFTRVISRPDWSSDIGDASKTGGPAVDLHIHDTHFIGLIAGIPQTVQSFGIVAADGAVEYLTTNYQYGSGGPILSCSSGAIAMKGRPFVHGFELYLERATLAHSSSGLPLTVYHADGTVQTPQLSGGGDPVNAFEAELQTAVSAIEQGKEARLLSGQLARDALAMCLKECESVRSGTAIKM